MKKVSFILLVLVAVFACIQGVGVVQAADADKVAAPAKGGIVAVGEEQVVDAKGDVVEETDWEALWGDETADEAAPVAAEAKKDAAVPAAPAK